MLIEGREHDLLSELIGTGIEAIDLTAKKLCRKHERPAVALSV